MEFVRDLLLILGGISLSIGMLSLIAGIYIKSSKLYFYFGVFSIGAGIYYLIYTGYLPGEIQTLIRFYISAAAVYYIFFPLFIAEFTRSRYKTIALIPSLTILAGYVVFLNTGNFFLGILFTQTFRAVDPNAIPPGESDTNPLGIAPFVNCRFDSTGLYVQTADIVALYDWGSGEIYVPIGASFGKVWVWEKASLNVYGEYRTSMIYKNWSGSAVKNSYRLNVSYTIPIGS